MKEPTAAMGFRKLAGFECLPKTNCCGIKAENNYILVRLANAFAFICMVVFNALASTGAIGQQIGKVSDSHPTYFTPASAAFSIWGMIYALMALYVVYQALPVDWPHEKHTALLYEDIGWLFVSMCFWNSLWIVVFSQSSLEAGSDQVVMWAAAVVISCLLFNNLWIYTKIQAKRAELNYWEMTSLMVGWSIYTAWVTAATILNMATALWTSGVRKPEVDEEAGAISMIVIALLVYMATTYVNGDPVYGLTFSWVTFWQADARGNPDSLWGGYTTYSTSVQTADYVACAIIATWSLLILFWRPGQMPYYKVWAGAWGKPELCCFNNHSVHGTAELGESKHINKSRDQL